MPPQHRLSLIKISRCGVGPLFAFCRTIGIAALSVLVGAAPAAAHPPEELESFVGARAGQAEMGLQNLGYENERSKGLTGYWWNAAEAVCVAIVTSQGRYRSIDIVKPSQCGKRLRPASQPAPSANMGQLPAYCRGEASAKFGVRPPQITTNMAFQSGNRMVVQGWFDGDNGSTFFNCWFDLNGRFQSVG